jgi:carboxyl-terminal processing protease
MGQLDFIETHQGQMTEPIGIELKMMKNTIRCVVVSALVTAVLSTWCSAAGDPGRTDSALIRARSGGAGLVKQVCDLIYQGQFSRAKRLIEASASRLSQSDRLRALAGIIAQYDAIQEDRSLTRKDAFNEQLDELKALGINHADESLVRIVANDTLDPNDPNEGDIITESLSVIARASEFADDKQRNALFDDAYVKEIVHRAIDRAAQYEADGKWLEAYSECHAWLKAIDPNNQGYEEHADALWDKIVISSSFEDSPCETSQERYQGVRKEIFQRVIRTLGGNYVAGIDYAEMATLALERCKLLAEVMAVRPQDANDMVNYERPEPDELTAWGATMDTLLAEVKRSPTGLNIKQFLQYFDRVLALNQTTVTLPEAILIAQFSEATLSGLDPHTAIIWPRQVEDFNKAMTNEFTGVGIEISKEKGLLTVASLLLDTPAYRSGLDAGDVIEAVNGVLTKDMSLHCAVKKITGPKGTEVNLTIRNADTDQLKEVTITRDRIVVPTIRGWLRHESGEWEHLVDEKERIAYVRLTSFSGETADDFEDVLRSIEGDGLNGLIVDLRANAGGLLSSAVAITNKFIRRGLIVSTQPQYGSQPEYSWAEAKDTHPDYPMVVLVNSASASASEIVSGALADDKYERAVLVGNRTHGKGSVQVIVSDPVYGAHLKYTMAYYHLPSGQRVNSQEAREKLGLTDWGVAPDVPIRLRSDELKALWDIQRDNAVLVQAKHVKSDSAVEKHTIQEILKADPQLAVALLVVRTKQIEAAAPVVAMH